MAEDKKILTITQYVKEIIYDIQNKTHLIGKTHDSEGGKSYEAISNMQVSDDDEISYQIKRSIANSFAALKNSFSEYLSEDEGVSDNLIPSEVDGDEELVLRLELPSNHNSAAVDSIGSNVHAYLVDAALGNWLAITSKADAETYIAHSAVSLENIKRALYKRSRPKKTVILN